MKKEASGFLKIIYFDEQAAQDYLDITNGGRLDWTKEENKERAAQILTEIEAKAKGGFNILEVIKATQTDKLADTLVEIALERGGGDNVTVAVVVND